MTSACILALALLRIALASMELHQNPLDTRRPRREQDFATLDAVALVPVMCMLLSHLADYVRYSSAKYKEGPLENVKKWQLIFLGALILLATALYVAGCVVAFQVDGKMPQALQAGTLLYVVTALSMLAAALKLPTYLKQERVRILSVMAVIMTIRLVWAMGSVWSVNSADSPFSPYRPTAAATWTHLGMVLVMEFLIAILCSWFGGHAQSLVEYQHLRV